MLRLASILFSLVGTALAGTLVIAAFTMGYYTWPAILGAVVVGVVLALPVSWVLAKRLMNS